MNIIDIFSGCGGFSVGFSEAGYTNVFALEKDEWAAETYKYNHPNSVVHSLDITKVTEPKSLVSNYNTVIDGIIGGPPCQGFSLSGDRDPKDPRNSLFMDYLRFVKSYSPKFFVMENVSGILSSKTKNGFSVVDVIKSESKKLNYNVVVIKLNASHYGVPQSRIRVFFIGIKNIYPINYKMLIPNPTHLNIPVTISDALSDLPIVESGEGCEIMDYFSSPKNSYQKWCRRKSKKVYNHVSMRHTARLVERFKNIDFGQSVADVAEEHAQRKRGNSNVISGKSFNQNNMRPFPDRPSPTVAASFQSNFIHPYYNRNYTAREGARLQSFPDHYIFKGKRTTMSWEKNLSQYQQIGNAVPPLLAKAIGSTIKKYFEKIHEITPDPPDLNQLDFTF